MESHNISDFIGTADEYDRLISIIHANEKYNLRGALDGNWEETMTLLENERLKIVIVASESTQPIKALREDYQAISIPNDVALPVPTVPAFSETLSHYTFGSEFEMKYQMELQQRIFLNTVMGTARGLGYQIVVKVREILKKTGIDKKEVYVPTFDVYFFRPKPAQTVGKDLNTEDISGVGGRVNDTLKR